VSDPSRPSAYGEAGVRTNQEAGLDALLKWVVPTERFRAGRLGRSVLPIGYFANVIDIGHGMGLALTTDGNHSMADCYWYAINHVTQPQGPVSAASFAQPARSDGKVASFLPVS
jgi:hypothetical protein